MHKSTCFTCNPVPPSIATATPSPNDPLFCSIHNDVVRSVYRFIAGGYCRRCRICHICIVCALPAVLVAMQCGLVFFARIFKLSLPLPPPPPACSLTFVHSLCIRRKNQHDGIIPATYSTTSESETHHARHTHTLNEKE